MSDGRRLKFLVITLSLAALAFFLFSFGLVRGKLDRGKKRKVARIDIAGPILSSGDIIEEIKRFRDDDSVGALLIRIDTPGGAVTPSQEIYRELLKIRESGKKKVVASIGSLGASGGYYIASAANKIYASPGSLVGNIGVLLELTKFEELFKKIGVESDVIKSGPYKDMGSPFRKTSPEERKMLQGVIDDTLRQFIEAVAKGRRLPEEKVIPLADGRIFTGAQAKEQGMVDELGDIEDAIDGAARMAGIEGKPEVVKPPKKWGWRALLENATSLLGRKLPLADSPGLMYLWRP